MPAFPLMRADDLEPLIDYVILLSQRGETEDYVRSLAEDYEEEEDIEFADFLDAIESTRSTWESAAEEVVLPSTAEPRYGVETVTAGRELFLREGCSSCHGADGKGQTEWLDPEFLMAQSELPDAEKIKINYDAWGEPAPAADLTSRLLHGGRRGIDIYRRIDTGINGTPMPAFAQVFAQNPEKVWNLVHYVRHVIEGGDPTVGIQEAAPASEESDTAETHDEEGSAQ